MSGTAQHQGVERQLRALAAQDGVTVEQVRVPEDTRLPVHVLVDASSSAARGSSESLTKTLKRRVVVVTRGRPLHVLLQLYQFLEDDLLFAVEDPLGVVAYFRDDAAVMKRAYGSGRVNQQTFERFTNGRLTIMTASEVLRRRVQAELEVRARGHEGFPAVPVEEVLAQQYRIVTEVQLREALARSAEELAWNLAPAGVMRGSYEFRVALQGRPVAQVHDLVGEALAHVAEGFGMEAHDITSQRPGNGKYRTYYLSGDLGWVQVKVFHSDKHKELTCVYPEKLELQVDKLMFMPLLVSMVRSRVQ